MKSIYEFLISEAVAGFIWFEYLIVVIGLFILIPLSIGLRKP